MNDPNSQEPTLKKSETSFYCPILSAAAIMGAAIIAKEDQTLKVKMSW